MSIFHPPPEKNYTGMDTGASSEGIRYEHHYKDGIPHGKWTEWSETKDYGVIKVSETNYKDGELHGIAAKWDISGIFIKETNWKNGKINGKSITMNYKRFFIGNIQTYQKESESN